MLAAEVVLCWRREQRPHLRAAAYLVSALANNLPDTDIVYTWITGPKPLGSLLHHRGHTHTLLLAVPMAWLLGLGAWRWLRRRTPAPEVADRTLIFGLALLGPLLHLLLDFGNSYGVHPFWPFSGRWFYGDSIFIVEPLWWAAIIPILAQAVRRRWLRLLLWALLGAVVLLTFWVPFVLPSSRAAVLTVAGLAFLVGRLGSERFRATFAVAAGLVIALVFVGASRLATAELSRASDGAFPALTAHDFVLSPMPANPACWEAMVVGEQGSRYRVLRASVALWPLRARECTAGSDVEPTALVQALERPDRGGVRWVSEYVAELSELRRLARDDCRFRALLKFARLPYYTEVTPATPSREPGRFAGDLRYDRDPGLEFADMRLPHDVQGGECPRFIPGWLEPRRLLLLP
jgi:inner membrane protein